MSDQKLPGLHIVAERCLTIVKAHSRDKNPSLDLVSDFVWALGGILEFKVNFPTPAQQEAADRIEAQEKRNKELEAALRKIVAMTPDPEFGTLPIESAIKVARAALGEKKDG
jgi:hypothetical protein